MLRHKTFPKLGSIKYHLILSHLILSYLILSYLILPYLILSYLDGMITLMGMRLRKQTHFSCKGFFIESRHAE